MTLVGWLTTIKSAIYVMLPRAHLHVIPDNRRLQQGLRAVGLVLGVLAGYDAFFQR